MAMLHVATWSSAYLLGAGVGIACLLFADESALQSSVLVDFHRLHLLLDGIHGGWLCVLLLQTRKKLQNEMELGIDSKKQCFNVAVRNQSIKSVLNNAIIITTLESETSHIPLAFYLMQSIFTNCYCKI